MMCLNNFFINICYHGLRRHHFMRQSLFFKLLGAFALVIVVGAIVTTLLAHQAAVSEFRTYTDRNGQVWAEHLAPALAEYYSQNNTWEGVTSVLQDSSLWTNATGMDPSSGVLSPTPISTPTPALYTVQSGDQSSNNTGQGMGHNGMMGMGMRQVPPVTDPIQVSPGAAMPNGMGHGQSMHGTTQLNMWSMMGHRIIIADAAGAVISDTSGQLDGAVLSSDQLVSGQPIDVAGQPAGTVLVDAVSTSPGTPAGEFLNSMNRSILIAVLSAGGVALLLGGGLFFQITSPLRELKAAASAIAAGDLSQRVPVRTSDELGQLALTFNHMAESLGRSENQRRQMIADVAHELRTPLSVMQANLEAVQDGILPLDAGEIASLHEETVLLSRMVADLHLLSVAEAGQLELQRVEVEPGDLICKATERLYQNAQDRGVNLTVETAPGLPHVLVDADRISQVISNLVSNSLRYTEAGGSVMVQVDAHSRNSQKSHPSEVLVSVTDTGSGIPAVDLPYIFDRFYRADKSRTRSSGGTGLGLAIVKHIVEAHGGKVSVESPVLGDDQSPFPGTRISFTIPTSI
jgi:two-component system OmpR family sensor kinase/two-component system sensor histidine kinase BaeS